MLPYASSDLLAKYVVIYHFAGLKEVAGISPRSDTALRLNAILAPSNARPVSLQLWS
jgi:hypothetical protein